MHAHGLGAMRRVQPSHPADAGVAGAAETAGDGVECATDDENKYRRRHEASAAAAAALDSTDRTACWLLLAAGLVTRFYALNYPASVVFDEYHFGKFTNGYVTGRYFFDIHPPLGKLIIAASAWYAGYDGSQPFARKS